MRGADIQSMHSVNPLDTELRTPSLKLAASGSVKLETMSWIEAIRRKHMDDGPGMPEIPMGKRAAAFQRLGAITEASTAAATAATATTSASIVSTPTISEVTNDVQDLHKANVTLNLDNIPGMQTEGEKYIIVLTCSICETRTARKISKKAYHNGVVICRCEKCKNLHLLADRMGVFEDASWDAQSHEKRMSTILERQNITVSHENDILEVTEAVQSDSDSDSDSDDDKPKKQSN
jgi:DNL zinc finger